MVATIAENLRRQNGAINENLLEQFRAAEENVSTDAGTQAALKQLQDIMSDRNDNSIESNKLAKQRLEFMERQVKNNDQLNAQDKEYFQQLIKQSKASTEANLGLKQKATELASVGLEKGIDSVGGAIAGALSNSPILAMGVNLVGGKIMEFRQQKKQNKAESDAKAKQAADDALQEQREVDFLKTKISNEDAITTAEQQAIFDQLETDNAREAFLDEQKELLIRSSKNDKIRADNEAARAKEEKQLREKFGIEEVKAAPPPANNNSIPSENPISTDTSSTSDNDNMNISSLDTITNKLDEIKSVLEYALIDNPPYLKHVQDGVEDLVEEQQDDSKSSLEIEDAREMKNHNKKLLKLLSGLGGKKDETAKEENSGMFAGIMGFMTGGGLKMIGGMILKFLPALAGMLAGGGILGKLGSMLGIDADAVDLARSKSGAPQSKSPAKKPGRIGRILSGAKNIASKGVGLASKVPIGGLVKSGLALGGLAASLPVAAGAAIMSPTAMADGTKPIDIGPVEKAQIAENQKLIDSENAKLKDGVNKKLTPVPTPANANIAPSPSAMPKAPIGIPPVNPANTKLGQVKKALNKGLLKKSATKSVGKLMTKQIPILGAIMGAGYAVNKLWQGDWAGGITEAVGVGAPSLTGLPFDLASMAQEVYNDMFGTKENPFPFAADAKNGSGGFKEAYDSIMKAVKETYEEARDKLLGKSEEQEEKVPTVTRRSGGITGSSSGRPESMKQIETPTSEEYNHHTIGVHTKDGNFQQMNRSQIQESVDDGNLSLTGARKALKFIRRQEDASGIGPSREELIMKQQNAQDLQSNAIDVATKKPTAVVVSANNNGTTLNNSGNSSVVNNTTKFDGVRNPDRSAQSVAYANGLGSNINW